MFKNALVSVSEKKGLVDFLKPFVEKGMRVVSTGGTAKHLKDSGVPVVEVSSQTGYPEVMDGRVRTLHPRIHIPLLARADVDEDLALLKKENLEFFDLVVVNLYPFENQSHKGLPDKELIEYIDVGGPSMLRAAAKNYERIAVVCDPDDYGWILERDQLALSDRKKLAARVFSHTAAYDSHIAETLANGSASKENSFSGRFFKELRYGENPQQKAIWYTRLGKVPGFQNAEILQGKELSYNNLLDLEASVQCVKHFKKPTAVVVKHNNPCGVASGNHSTEALEKALSSDPVSAFGGIVAVNGEVDEAGATLLSKIFLECIVAPRFSEAALKIFSAKKNLRLLKLNFEDFKSSLEIRTISGGFLVQTPDSVDEWLSEWTVEGEIPSDSIKKDLLFAWKVCASLKSNAIAIASGEQSRGLGMGQVNRVDAVKQAIERQKEHHPGAENLVLASDAFFPFADSIEVASKNGVKWVIQPGGSVKDPEVRERAKALGVGMVLTGKRHFKH